MNPVDITNKYPHKSDLSYQIKEIDFKSAYLLCWKDFGKKPTIEDFLKFKNDNNLKINEKSFFEFLKNFKEEEPVYKTTNKFKLLAAIILLIGTSVFLFGNTNNFYSNKTFIDNLKEEYSKVKVTKDFISCESGKRLDDKPVYYDMRDEYLHKRYSLNKNSIGRHKLLVISNLLENTTVQDGERVFCIREKPLKQIEVEELLKNDRWKVSKWMK